MLVHLWKKKMYMSIMSCFDCVFFTMAWKSTKNLDSSNHIVGPQNSRNTFFRILLKDFTVPFSWGWYVWEIWTRKWVIQTMGESRSVSEVHKSNLGARFNKNHQVIVKLHTMIMAWLMCAGSMITPWTVWVWKTGWFRLSMQH